MKLSHVRSSEPHLSCLRHCARSRRTNLQKGFTLFELVIVLGVVGILAAMAVPRLTPSGNTLTAQSLRLSRDLRHVQAIAMNKGHTVVFDVQSVSSYRATYGGSVILDPVSGQPYEVTLEDGVTMNAMDVEFDSMGRPALFGNPLSAEQDFTLSVNSRTSVVRLSPVTGFVEVLP